MGLNDSTLRAHGVTFTYPRTSTAALTDITVELPAGQALAVVGESGSGKSTLGRLLSGQTAPDEGSVFIERADGVALASGHLPFRRAVQVVFQDPSTSFSPKTSVGAVLHRPLRLIGVRSRSERDARVTDLLARVSLPSDPAFLRQQAASLSGGQKQRLAIARALTVDPEFLIADEAISALDVTVAARLIDVFRQLISDLGVGVLFITHDLAVARSLCGDVLVMRNGEVVEQGSTATVMFRPQHPYTKELIAAHPVPEFSSDSH
ncbi:ATP-binding cassette domain-containing protein [Nocardioides sp. NPDC004968]|uniref:ABC transporter ATP-binding protein n=1 Tax=Nocardioides sp. NPDC004968 TaxID=3155894 RepID=UPI0033B1CFDB